jgi:hypothetical protein
MVDKDNIGKYYRHKIHNKYIYISSINEEKNCYYGVKLFLFEKNYKTYWKCSDINYIIEETPSIKLNDNWSLINIENIAAGALIQFSKYIGRLEIDKEEIPIKSKITIGNYYFIKESKQYFYLENIAEDKLSYSGTMLQFYDSNDFNEYGWKIHPNVNIDFIDKWELILVIDLPFNIYNIFSDYFKELDTQHLNFDSNLGDWFKESNNKYFHLKSIERRICVGTLFYLVDNIIYLINNSSIFNDREKWISVDFSQIPKEVKLQHHKNETFLSSETINKNSLIGSCYKNINKQEYFYLESILIDRYEGVYIEGLSRRIGTIYEPYNFYKLVPEYEIPEDVSFIYNNLKGNVIRSCLNRKSFINSFYEFNNSYFYLTSIKDDIFTGDLIQLIDNKPILVKEHILNTTNLSDWKLINLEQLTDVVRNKYLSFLDIRKEVKKDDLTFNNYYRHNILNKYLFVKEIDLNGILYTDKIELKDIRWRKESFKFKLNKTSGDNILYIKGEDNNLFHWNKIDPVYIPDEVLYLFKETERLKIPTRYNPIEKYDYDKIIF